MRALLFALLLGAATAHATDDVVARVDGAPITEAMVNAVVKGAISGRGEAPSSEEIAKLSDAALESLIDLELLYAAAQKHAIAVSDAQVDAEVARSRARFAKPSDYDAALTRSGMSQAQLRADTRKTLMVNAFLEKVVWKDVRVAPDAAQQYYDQHRAELGNKSFATLRPAIERSLLDDQRQQAQRAYLLELKKTAVIQRGPAPTAVPTARPTPVPPSQPS
ncbi:MAG TPA: SurA N-terminal domain-containing protein [Candidatus Dormibacteraeota bacterium]|nr:SurA N-terminal domain-containing protein [Candidatus Dormibacteraeota bacterium]